MSSLIDVVGCLQAPQEQPYLFHVAARLAQPLAPPPAPQPDHALAQPRPHAALVAVARPDHAHAVARPTAYTEAELPRNTALPPPQVAR